MAVAAAASVMPAHGVLATGAEPTPATDATSIVCEGTITTALDAAGTMRPVCVTRQPASVGDSGSSTSRDTTYGILIGTGLVIAGSVTSLRARRRRLALGKPFRRRSA